ncbi:MAG: hypothetical protein HXO60_07040 [Rothia mucilaginosa]|uniref:hypothetical protein n=1 Tax=Rothia mucilaginosa TaxID=43675 RepID=UPI001CB1E216|nr:hypothetical protein [Rothia mucilaginosa]MBF1652239.1 hypothetical protein [Rothia mucilaginosa]
MSNNTRDIALVATTTASLVLFYRCLFLAGIVAGIQKTNKSAVTSFRARLSQIRFICENSEMSDDQLKAIHDLVDRPL